MFAFVFPVPNTNYSIAVRAISTFGEGKRTPPLYIITLKNPLVGKSSDSTVAIAVGSVIPVILVVILVVVGIFLIRKRAGRKNHKDSLEVNCLHKFKRKHLY